MPPPALTVLPRPRFLVVRLRPGDLLKESLLEAVTAHKLDAAAVVTCVGSLSKAALRMANAAAVQSNPVKTWAMCLEIVSLTGTLGPDGLHLHCSLSDDRGNVIGGHLMGGSVVHTTAEIVLVDFSGKGNAIFRRTLDPQTGFSELDVAVQSHSIAGTKPICGDTRASKM